MLYRCVLSKNSPGSVAKLWPCSFHCFSLVKMCGLGDFLSTDAVFPLEYISVAVNKKMFVCARARVCEGVCMYRLYDVCIHT